jgi:hypothetical protein
MDPGTFMAAVSLITNIIGGFTGNKGEQKSSFSKNQQQGSNDLFDIINNIKGGAQDITQNPQFQQGNEFLNNLFNDPSFFQNIEAPAFRQFNEQIAPDIANRFASMGSGGSTGSTAFRNQINREGSNLAENLSAQRTGMQMQALPQTYAAAQQPFSNMMQLYNQAMGQPIMNQYQPPSAGIGALSAPFAQGATSYWGGQGGQRFPGQSSSTY